jgi:predicted MFS family arabinose efflux permease
MISKIKETFSGIPRAVWLLSFVSFINRSGAMVICFITLYLTEKLGFSLKEAGYMMTMYGIGDVAGAYIGGRWVDRYGYQRIQLLTLLASGIFLLVLMMMRGFWEIGFTLFVFNFFATAFRPANSIAIRLNSTNETRTRSFSLMRVMVNLAISVALIGGGLLIALGWEWIFWADSLTCFVAAAFVYFYIPEKKIEKQNTLNTEIKSNFSNNTSPYKDKNYLLFTLMTFLGAMVFMQIIWTVPPFFKKIYHWDESMIGMMSAVNGIIVMLVEMPLVVSIEGKKSNLWLIRMGIILYAASYLMLTLPINYAFYAAFFYMLIISFGEIFVMPFSSTWVTKIAPERTQGQYLALYTIAYSVANILAPLLGTQVIAAFGFDALWIVLAGICGMAFLGFGSLSFETKK